MEKSQVKNNKPFFNSFCKYRLILLINHTKMVDNKRKTFLNRHIHKIHHSCRLTRLIALVSYCHLHLFFLYFLFRRFSYYILKSVSKAKKCELQSNNILTRTILKFRMQIVIKSIFKHNYLSSFFKVHIKE